jgi:hypothetical protein
MRYIFFLLIGSFCPLGLVAQNLVPNPSFEEYKQCAPFQYFDGFVKYWERSKGSVDYFNACSEFENGVPYSFLGYQAARTGQAFAAGVCYHSVGGESELREYLMVKLFEPLKKDSTYCGSFWVNMPDFYSGQIANVGMWLSDTAVYGSPLYGSETLIETVPNIENKYDLITDSINWVRIAGSFRAKGGEQYLIIGNFRNDANTIARAENGYALDEMIAYIFFDDVCLTPAPSIGQQLELGSDSVYCEAFTPKVLSAPVGFEHYTWSTGDTTATVTATAPGIYWVHCDLECCRFSDTIRLELKKSVDGLFPFSDTTICEGASIKINLPQGLSYSWDDGDLQPKREFTEPGTYICRAQNECQTLSDTFSVQFHEAIPTLQLGADTTNCLGGQIREVLLDAGPTHPNYLWSNGAISASIIASEPGLYHVVSQYPCGIATDSIVLKGCNQPDDYKIFVPNVFSPDQADENSLVMPFVVGAVVKRFIIFDRGGGIVFESTENQLAWNGNLDGKKCLPGVYTYLLELEVTTSGKRVLITGDITLVR